MEELKVFENEKFGKVRTMVVNDEPWFVGKDVVDILGYQNGSRDINRHVDEADRQNYQNGTFDSPRGMTIINESGLYSLIFSSKLPSAKEFKRWVTSEVLPSIRKHGGYIEGQNELTNAELMAKALLVAQNTIESKERELEVMRPKALFADAVSGSINSIPLGELARYLRQNGIPVGRTRLMEDLREKGFLVKLGKNPNLPSQRGMEAGLFEIQERVVKVDGRRYKVASSTLVTGKGQRFFMDWYMRKGVV